jgi:hypothetical protein
MTRNKPNEVAYHVLSHHIDHYATPDVTVSFE